MQYRTGIEVQVGDKVRLNDDELAEVVAVLDEGKFLSSIDAREWSYLNEGALIQSIKYGLFHYSNISDEVKFIARG